MRLLPRLLLVSALALAAPAARAGEETPTAATGEDAESSLAQQISSKEVRVPIRNQYYRTPGGYALGDFTATFFASELVTFDDNVFLSESDTESDLIFNTAIGTRLTTAGARSEVDFAAAISRDNYVRDSGSESYGGWIEGIARFGPERGLYTAFHERALARDTTVVTSLAAPGSPVVGTTTTIERSFQNNAGATIGNREEKYAVDLHYDFSVREYSGSLEAQTNVEHRVTLAGRRIHSPKSEFGLDAETRTVRFTEPLNNDYETLGGFANALWNYSPKTSFTGRFGYLTQRTAAGGTAPRSTEFAGTLGTFTVGHEVSPTLYVSAVASRDVFPALGNSYQLIGIVATSARWEFRNRWLARAGLSLQESRYSDGPDGRYATLEVGVAWDASEQVQASLSWAHQLFAGEAANSDYTKNLITLQLSVNF